MPPMYLALKGGTIDMGDVADLILIDPKKLAEYDGETSAQRIHREEFSHEQLVNRSDGVVELGDDWRPQCLGKYPVCG
jgi:dihydroorotase-like cyclic amidohydrolase